jgi:glycosyltransferase involved in cell wall biosynthesis
MSRVPEVTVVIPTRNRWDLLSTAALPSAFRQEDVEIEVVVVDEGSTDFTAQGLASLSDPRVRVVRHDRARGVAQARNAGIREARGEWIAFLDDDDLWAPRKLRLQLDSALEEDAVFAYGGAAAVREDRSWLYSLLPSDPQPLRRVLLSRNVLWGGCSNVVVKAGVVRDLGGFDEELFQLCDWDLWIRLASAGRAAAQQEVVVACIEHERSMLLTSEDDVFEEFDYLEAKHRPESEALATRPDRALFTRWVAFGHRRSGRRLRSASIYLRGSLASRAPTDVARAVLALVGPRPTERRLVGLGSSGLDGRTREPLAEPPWLELYRRPDEATSAQATSKASSPTDA